MEHTFYYDDAFSELVDTGVIFADIEYTDGCDVGRTNDITYRLTGPNAEAVDSIAIYQVSTDLVTGELEASKRRLLARKSIFVGTVVSGERITENFSIAGKCAIGPRGPETTHLTFIARNTSGELLVSARVATPDPYGHVPARAWIVSPLRATQFPWFGLPSVDVWKVRLGFRQIYPKTSMNLKVGSEERIIELWAPYYPDDSLPRPFVEEYFDIYFLRKPGDAGKLVSIRFPSGGVNCYATGDAIPPMTFVIPE